MSSNIIDVIILVCRNGAAFRPMGSTKLKQAAAEAGLLWECC